MTSLYDRIQTLGNKMVANLAAKGVSAQFSDGGLTLADKILEINTFNDGVFLAADKMIAQSSNTIHLSSMVVDEGMFKVGEHISIEDKVNTTPIYTKTHFNEDPSSPDSINEPISSGAWALVFGTYTGSDDCPWIRVAPTTTTGNEGIDRTNDGFKLFSSSVTLEGDILYFYNGLFWTDTGDSQQVSYSELGQVVWLEGTVSFYRIYGGGITGNNGAVGGIYTCSGAGKKEIVGKSGNLVSETYDVLDCIYYDDMSTDTNTNYYLNTLNNSISYDSTNKKLVVTALNSNGMYVDLRGLLNQVKGKTVKIEVDVEPINCSLRLQCFPQGNGVNLTDLVSTATTLITEPYDVPSDSTNAYFRISGSYVSSSSSFKFKNWKIYVV